MAPVVLVAEANREHAVLLQNFLVRHGYVVEIASDALKCLVALQRLSPDVIVLDLELPWGGGESILARLRENRPNLPPSVVLTTGDTDCPPELLDVPVVGWLRKPFTPSELLCSMAATIPRRSRNRTTPDTVGVSVSMGQ
jgi:two-component system OmpR family response regulator